MSAESEDRATYDPEACWRAALQFCADERAAGRVASHRRAIAIALGVTTYQRPLPLRSDLSSALRGLRGL